MTTTVTIHTHNRAVRVQHLDPATGADITPATWIGPHATTVLHVHPRHDLRIHEIQPPTDAASDQPRAA